MGKKLSELSQKAADGYLELLLSASSDQRRNAAELLSYVVKALITGNIGSVVLLVPVASSMLENNLDATGLFTPMVWFLVGAGASGTAIFLLAELALRANAHIENLIKAFLQDEVPIDQLRGYGYPQIVGRAFGLLNLLSIVCFVVGVVSALKVLLHAHN